jgi:hypothetical protein
MSVNWHYFKQIARQGQQ